MAMGKLMKVHVSGEVVRVVIVLWQDGMGNSRGTASEADIGNSQDAEQAAAGQCVVARDPTTVLRWTLGKDKSQVLRISVEAAALAELKQLDGEVSVMSIVGPYRTGKSFLLNQILAELVDPELIANHVSPHFQVS